MPEPLKDSAIVVFDFDKTLTEKDTVFGFFWFGSKSGVGVRRYWNAVVYWGLVICTKLGFVTLVDAKNYGIRKFLGHLKEEELDSVAESYARSITLNWLYQEEFPLYRENAWIVSASPANYLKFLFPPERLLATTLEFDSKGYPIAIKRNCQGRKKVDYLLEQGISKIDRLYTDSKSDAPLSEISKETYLISGKTLKKVDQL